MIKIFALSYNANIDGSPLDIPIITGNIPVKELLMLLISTTIREKPPDPPPAEVPKP